MKNWLKPLAALTFICFFQYSPQALAKESIRLAYSKSTGLEVFADSVAGSWCDKAIILRFYNENEEIYSQSGKLDNAVAKIGKIISSECPIARAVSIYGYGKNKDLLTQANASLIDDLWLINKRQNPSVATTEDNHSNEPVAYKDFSVNGWKPPKLGDAFKIDTNSNEFLINTEDGKCSIRYGRILPEKTSPKNWHIIVKGNPCHNTILNGKASIRVFDDKGEIDGEGTGYFTEGYFTFDKGWDVQLIRRYAINKNEQKISYIIESDADKEIHYVGYLSSDLVDKIGKYTKWYGCSPLIINAVTTNTALFNNENKIKEIVEKAGSLASELCPDNKSFSLIASNAPHNIVGADKKIHSDYDWSNDKKVYYSVNINKDGDKWTYSPDMARNRITMDKIIKEAERLQKLQDMNNDYKKLNQASFDKKLAFFHGSLSIDDLIKTITATQLTDSSKYINSLVRINKIDIDGVYSDYPINMAIKFDTKKIAPPQIGWSIISGKLSPSDNGLLKAKVTLDKFTGCLKEKCSEANDAIFLVRRKYNEPNWLPEISESAENE